MSASGLGNIRTGNLPNGRSKSVTGKHYITNFYNSDSYDAGHSSCAPSNEPESEASSPGNSDAWKAAPIGRAITPQKKAANKSNLAWTLMSSLRSPRNSPSGDFPAQYTAAADTAVHGGHEGLYETNASTVSFSYGNAGASYRRSHTAAASLTATATPKFAPRTTDDPGAAATVASRYITAPADRGGGGRGSDGRAVRKALAAMAAVPPPPAATLPAAGRHDVLAAEAAVAAAVQMRLMGRRQTAPQLAVAEESPAAGRAVQLLPSQAAVAVAGQVPFDLASSCAATPVAAAEGTFEAAVAPTTLNQTANVVEERSQPPSSLPTVSSPGMSLRRLEVVAAATVTVVGQGTGEPQQQQLPQQQLMLGAEGKAGGAALPLVAPTQQQPELLDGFCTGTTAAAAGDGLPLVVVGEDNRGLPSPFITFEPSRTDSSHATATSHAAAATNLSTETSGSTAAAAVTLLPPQLPFFNAIGLGSAMEHSEANFLSFLNIGGGVSCTTASGDNGSGGRGGGGSAAATSAAGGTDEAECDTHNQVTWGWSSAGNVVSALPQRRRPPLPPPPQQQQRRCADVAEEEEVTDYSEAGESEGDESQEEEGEDHMGGFDVVVGSLNRGHTRRHANRRDARGGGSGGAAPETAAAASTNGGGSTSNRSAAAVERYGTLLASSAGWRCTEMYDMHDSLLLSKLRFSTAAAAGSGGGGGSYTGGAAAEKGYPVVGSMTPAAAAGAGAGAALTFAGEALGAEGSVRGGLANVQQQQQLVKGAEGPTAAGRVISSLVAADAAARSSGAMRSAPLPRLWLRNVAAGAATGGPALPPAAASPQPSFGGGASMAGMGGGSGAGSFLGNAGGGGGSFLGGIGIGIGGGGGGGGSFGGGGGGTSLAGSVGGSITLGGGGGGGGGGNAGGWGSTLAALQSQEVPSRHSMHMQLYGNSGVGGSSQQQRPGGSRNGSRHSHQLPKFQAPPLPQQQQQQQQQFQERSRHSSFRFARTSFPAAATAAAAAAAASFSVSGPTKGGDWDGGGRSNKGGRRLAYNEDDAPGADVGAGALVERSSRLVFFGGGAGGRGRGGAGRGGGTAAAAAVTGAGTTCPPQPPPSAAAAPLPTATAAAALTPPVAAAAASLSAAGADAASAAVAAGTAAVDASNGNNENNNDLASKSRSSSNNNSISMALTATMLVAPASAASASISTSTVPEPGAPPAEPPSFQPPQPPSLQQQQPPPPLPSPPPAAPTWPAAATMTAWSNPAFEATIAASPPAGRQPPTAAAAAEAAAAELCGVENAVAAVAAAAAVPYMGSMDAASSRAAADAAAATDGDNAGGASVAAAGADVTPKEGDGALNNGGVSTGGGAGLTTGGGGVHDSGGGEQRSHLEVPSSVPPPALAPILLPSPAHDPVFDSWLSSPGVEVTGIDDDAEEGITAHDSRGHTDMGCSTSSQQQQHHMVGVSTEGAVAGSGPFALGSSELAGFGTHDSGAKDDGGGDAASGLSAAAVASWGVVQQSPSPPPPPSASASAGIADSNAGGGFGGGRRSTGGGGGAKTRLGGVLRTLLTGLQQQQRRQSGNGSGATSRAGGGGDGGDGGDGGNNSRPDSNACMEGNSNASNTDDIGAVASVGMFDLPTAAAAAAAGGGTSAEPEPSPQPSPRSRGLRSGGLLSRTTKSLLQSLGNPGGIRSTSAMRKSGSGIPTYSDGGADAGSGGGGGGGDGGKKLIRWSVSAKSLLNLSVGRAQETPQPQQTQRQRQEAQRQRQGSRVFRFLKRNLTFSGAVSSGGSSRRTTTATTADVASALDPGDLLARSNQQQVGLDTEDTFMMMTAMTTGGRPNGPRSGPAAAASAGVDGGDPWVSGWSYSSFGTGTGMATASAAGNASHAASGGRMSRNGGPGGGGSRKSFGNHRSSLSCNGNRNGNGSSGRTSLESDSVQVRTRLASLAPLAAAVLSP